MSVYKKNLLLHLPGHDTAPAPAESVRMRFARLAGEHGDHVALCGLQQPWMDFATLHSEIVRISDTLLRAGIGRGDVVAIALPNGPEALIAILAVASVAVAMPFDPKEPAEGIAKLMERVPMAAALYDGSRQSTLRQLAETSDMLQLPVTCDPKASVSWQFADPLPEAPRPAAPTDVSDAAILIRTSGTTAEPKIVAWSQASILLSCDACADWMGLGSSDRSLCVMPFSHLHSVVRSTLPGLLRGGSVVCAPGFDRFHILEQIAAFAPTYMTAVSGILRMMLERAESEGVRTLDSSLRFLASGSDSIDLQTVRTLSDVFGVPVREFYGMSEVSPMLAATPSGELAREHGHIGDPVALWNVECLDGNGDAVATGEEGEVAVYGGLINPTLAALSNATVRAGRHRFLTGDMGRYGPDGHLWITGRADDRINRGGQKIAPEAIEATLLRHPQVKHAVVFPFEDTVLTQRVAAAVVPYDTAQVQEQQLRTWVARAHPDYMVPERIVFLSALPQNRVGKVNRKTLAAQINFTVSRPAEAKADLQHRKTKNEIIIEQIYRELLQKETINIHGDFMQMGGDSFLATTLLMTLEEYFGVMLTPAQFLEHGSVAALAKFVRSQSTDAVLDPLVLLRQGDDDCPLFITHAVTGYAWYAHVLAHCTPPSQTVYTLRWQPPKSGTWHESLEAYATVFADAIIDRCPEGPLALAGHSFGAQFAYELAQQLLRRGREPAFVGLIDDEADLHKRRFGIRLQDPASASVMHQCRHMLHSYVPCAYPGSLTRIHAAIKDHEVLSDPLVGWGDLALGTLDVIEVPGDHVTMMNEESIVQWVSILESNIASARELWVRHQQNTDRCRQLIVQAEAHERQPYVHALLQARRAAKEGQIEAEIRHYEAAIMLRANLPYWVYTNLADAYWQQQRHDDALETLTTSIQHQHVAITGYCRMADWLKQLGRDDEYNATLGRLTRLDAQTPEAQFTIGTFMLDHRHDTRAETHLRLAVALEPQHYEAIRSLCALLVRQCHFDDAYALASSIFKQNRMQDDFVMLYVKLLRCTDRGQEARAVSKIVIKQFPDNAYLKLQYAELLFENGDAPTGESVLENISLTYPDDLSLNLSLLTLSLKYSDAPTAAHRLSSLASRLPELPQSVGAVQNIWRKLPSTRISRWLAGADQVKRQLRLISLLARPTLTARIVLMILRTFFAKRMLASETVWRCGSAPCGSA